MSDEYNVETKSGASWHLPAIIVLGLIAIGGLAFGWNASSKLDATQQAVTTQVNSFKQGVEQDMSSLKDRIAQDEKANTDLQGDLKVITDKLKITQGQLKKARAEAVAANQDTTQKLTALDTGLRTELATKAASDDLKNVDTKVGGVRTDLDTTREDLKMARSEMGTLIARNHDEIDQLRRMGQRDYYEFTVTRKAGAQKVGMVQVELKDTNTKKNQFTINVLADDKSFEKKNRSVNEPIFFYTGGTRQAVELVINKVSKTAATGYLSVPKNGGSSTASNNSGNGQ